MRQLRSCCTAIAIALSTATAALEPFAGGAPLDVPFTLHGAHVVVNVDLGHGPALPFLLDSGLARSHMLDARVAQALGLQGERGLQFRAPDGSTRQGTQLRLGEIRIGDARLADQPFAVVDLPERITRGHGGAPLAGFLGAPLMDDAVLCIDYARGRLSRWPRAAFDDRGWHAVPMALRRGVPTLQLRIDGRPARLIVDTGNNAALVVQERYAREHDFARRYPDLERGSAHAGGAAFETRSGQARRAELGPRAAFREVPMIVIPDGLDAEWGIDGMMGFELLSMLDPCLDRDGGRFLYRR